MEIVNHLFENRGLSEYNDDVYVRTFDLKGHSYSINLTPEIDTSFWRFGLAVGRTKDFIFSPDKGRYSNRELKFIQLNVGDYTNKHWSRPEKYEIQTYYIEEYDKPLKTFINEATHLRPHLQIECDPDLNYLFLSIVAGDQRFLLDPISIKYFRYFKLFAWADETPFKIACQLKIDPELYSFVRIALNENERKYLQIMYSNFLKGINIETPYDLKEIWTQFPSSFHPDQISYLLLVASKEITLYGIWLLDPNSDIFRKFDIIALTIKDILVREGQNPKIDIEKLKSLRPFLSTKDISTVLKLMGYMGNFYRGSTSQNNVITSITINDKDVLEHYRRYTGLQEWMNAYLSKSGINGSITDGREPFLQTFKSIANKTVLKRKHSSAFTPVMGVTSLAQDLANVIHDLPDEKGQMIGLFGKWGRGKTFFVKELWKQLEKVTSQEYIKIEYHAWKYQETPASWAYLYELFSQSYLGKLNFKNFTQYHSKLLKLNFSRFGLFPIITLFLSALVTGFLIFLSSRIGNWMISLGISLSILLAWFMFLNVLKRTYAPKAAELVKKYTLRHNFKVALGIQADIQAELLKLFKVWIPEIKGKVDQKVLLVIEDLDRCTEERIIQSIDALRIMLDDEEISKRLIILTAIDERILKNAIRNKYRTLGIITSTSQQKPESNQSIFAKEIVAEYIDKLFILAIKLGELDDIQKAEFLKELIRDHLPEQSDSVNPTFTSTTFEANAPTKVLATANTAIIDVPNEARGTKTDGSSHQASTRPIEKPSSGMKLSSTEHDYLTELICTWPGATPRKISIFYYRYLLLKNLLFTKYENMQRDNPWQNDLGIRAILQIILHYMDSYDPDLLAKEKNKILAIIEFDNVVDVIPLSLNFKTKKQDYLRLLEVLELVIAY